MATVTVARREVVPCVQISCAPGKSDRVGAESVRVRSAVWISKWKLSIPMVVRCAIYQCRKRRDANKPERNQKLCLAHEDQPSGEGQERDRKYPGHPHVQEALNLSGISKAPSRIVDRVRKDHHRRDERQKDENEQQDVLARSNNADGIRPRYAHSDHPSGAKTNPESVVILRPPQDVRLL